MSNRPYKASPLLTGRVRIRLLVDLEHRLLSKRAAGGTNSGPTSLTVEPKAKLPNPAHSTHELQEMV